MSPFSARFTTMTRYLGIDFGTKRIGLAVNDPDGILVSPVATVTARSKTCSSSRTFPGQ